MSETGEERPRLRLEWLAIQHFREIAPGTRLEFAPGINLVLGMNGSGKTTLLDLIAACVRGNFAAYAEESFAVRFGMRLGTRRYEFEVTNEETVPSPDLRELLGELPLSPPKRIATTRVVERDGARETCSIEVSAERVRRWDEGRPEAIEIPQLFDTAPLGFSLTDMIMYASLHQVGSAWRMTLARTPLVRPGQQRATVRFDEALGFFQAITAQATNETAALLILKMRASGAVLPQAPAPSSLLDAALALYLSTSDHTFRLTEEHLPTLGAVARLTGFKKIEMAFAAPEVRDERDGTAFLYRPPDFLCTREDGQVVRHNHLSFGQKRLLAFFYYAACNPDIVVADELVNGLHHGWIARSLQEIGDRQAFLTSQNPLLVDMVDFQGVDELRRSFVVCRADHEPDDPKRRLILRWRPLDAREAEELATLLAVDVQPASEILLAMGLW